MPSAPGARHNSAIHSHEARQTRSGLNYSPWAARLGAPLSFTFDIAPLAQIAEEQGELASLSDSDVEQDEDDLPVRSTPPASTVQQSAERIPESAKQQSNGRSKSKLRDKLRYRERRRSARLAAESEQLARLPTQRRIKVIALKARRSATSISASLDISASEKCFIGCENFSRNPVASSGFMGRRFAQSAGDRQQLSKEGALAAGFRHVPWDGCEPRALLDITGRVFAVLAGRPKDVMGWDRVNDEVQKAFEDARSRYHADPKQESHRRGEYTAISAGISYGGGQKRVSNLSHSKHNQAIISGLLKNPSIRRLAGFADASFKLFAPRMYAHYEDTMQTLLSNDRTLEPNFSKNVFGAATFNLGPQVATYVHTDHLNLPAGWCTVTAIGQFNPKEGGHLLLWDLKLMIEFPPGALILIPSAVLRHSNTTVAPEERRYSFTQYSAGGLFRWVECGFRSYKAFKESGGVLDVSGSERWLRGVNMWSTWDELKASPQK